MKNERSAPAVTNKDKQTPLTSLIGAKPPRMHAGTREAIELLVRTGMTQRWCAQQAGIDENSLSRALKKPHIAKYYEEQQILALQDLKTIRKRGEIAAINTGIELMQNAESEAVRARMVEFFGRGAINPSPSTVVNVQNNVGSTGYEMARPGQRVVDIVSDGPNADATDSKSVDHTPDEQ